MEDQTEQAKADEVHADQQAELASEQEAFDAQADEVEQQEKAEASETEQEPETQAEPVDEPAAAEPSADDEYYLTDDAFDLSDAQLSTLAGDIRDVMLMQVRDLRKPWQQLNENAQRDLANAIDDGARNMVRKAIRMLSAYDFPRIDVTLGEVKIIGGEKARTEAKITGYNDHETREILGEHAGQKVILLAVDPEQFLGERSAVQIDVDQPDLVADPHADEEGLYNRAVQNVIKSGNASTSQVQRVLSIGYNKAARLIDRMQEDGIISAPDEAGARTVHHKMSSADDAAAGKADPAPDPAESAAETGDNDPGGDPEAEPEQDGYEWARDGGKMKDNPYDAETEQDDFDAWKRGWKKFKADAQNSSTDAPAGEPEDGGQDEEPVTDAALASDATPAQSTPYLEGMDACSAGETEDANSYDPEEESDNYKAWAKGWSDAKSADLAPQDQG